jgi:hypothetical protein
MPRPSYIPDDLKLKRHPAGKYTLPFLYEKKKKKKKKKRKKFDFFLLLRL